jgi:hypothetical protein
MSDIDDHKWFVERALREYEEALNAYEVWRADWIIRHYRLDPVTGQPLKENDDSLT